MTITSAFIPRTVTFLIFADYLGCLIVLFGIRIISSACSSSATLRSFQRMYASIPPDFNDYNLIIISIKNVVPFISFQAKISYADFLNFSAARTTGTIISASFFSLPRKDRYPSKIRVYCGYWKIIKMKFTMQVWHELREAESYLFIRCNQPPS